MIKVYPSTISGQLHAPASKSHAQRLLFMASMAAQPTTVKNVPICDDIDTTISCLETLGCSISRNLAGTEIVVKPFPKTSPMPEVSLNFNESSTTAHFAVALCSALGMKADCRAVGTLVKRKMVEMTSKFALRNVVFSSFSLPFSLSGRLSSGEFCFAGDEGSQSISATMMFASCLLNDSDIILTSPLVDDSYVKLTKSAMEDFGLKIEETEKGFHIIGRQYYQSPGEIETENDWGLATMWALAGAASGRNGNGVVVDQLNPDSVQKYKNAVGAFPLLYQNFRDINLDVSMCPNLATVMCAMAIVKGSSIHLKGVPQLKHKETDRLAVMARIADEFGQKAIINGGDIEIIGDGNPQFPDKPIDCQGDPWIFMSMVLASTTAQKPIYLSDEHCANKIYRDFLNDFKNLGGKFEIE